MIEALYMLKKGDIIEGYSAAVRKIVKV